MRQAIASAKKYLYTGCANYNGVGSALLILSIFLMLTYVIAFLLSAYHLINYPYQINYGEGPLIDEAKQLISGEMPYHKLIHPPFVVGNYPPVYPILLAGIIKISGHVSMFPLRLFSTTITIWISFIISSIVYRSTRVLGISIIAGLVWLSLKDVFDWGTYIRIDMAGILFELIGLWIVISYKNSKLSLFSCVFFLLGAFTRQDLVFAALASYIWQYTQNKRYSIESVLIFATSGVILLAIINLLSHGSFLYNIIYLEASAFHLNQARWAIEEYILRNPIFILLTIIGVIYSFSEWEKYGALGLYSIFTFIGIITIGKVGSDINYFLEFEASACIIIGITLAGLSTYDKLNPSHRNKNILLLLLCCQLLLWAHPQPTFTSGWDRNDHLDSKANDHKIIEIIKHTKGPVISENMGLAVLAGKNLFFQPFIMTQLSNQHKWNQALILNDLAKKKIALILLSFPVDYGSYNTKRFSNKFIAYVRDNYHLVSQIGKYYLYYPKGQ